MTVRYWLMKSEPSNYSIEDLERDKKSGWDGIRNYQARNFMRDDMRVGDRVFFYHSNCKPPGIVGVAEVSKEKHIDPTQFDPKSDYYDKKATKEKPIWEMVEVTFLKAYKGVLSLDALREHKDKELADFQLLMRGNRLSILPLTNKHWKFIDGLANKVTASP